MLATQMSKLTYILYHRHFEGEAKEIGRDTVRQTKHAMRSRIELYWDYLSRRRSLSVAETDWNERKVVACHRANTWCRCRFRRVSLMSIDGDICANGRECEKLPQYKSHHKETVKVFV